MRYGLGWCVQLNTARTERMMRYLDHGYVMVEQTIAKTFSGEEVIVRESPVSPTGSYEVINQWWAYCPLCGCPMKRYDVCRGCKAEFVN